MEIGKAEHLPPVRKRAVLEIASPLLDTIKILIRLAHDMALFDERLYLQMEGEMQEIGRMLGGWIKSLA